MQTITTLSKVSKAALAALTFIAFGLPLPAQAEEPAGDVLAVYGGQDAVFTGTLDAIQRGPTAKSLPPIYSTRLMVTVDEVFRGDVKAGQQITLAHRARQMQEPQFPEGKKVLVGAKRDRRHLMVNAIEVASDDVIARARKGMAIPLGWQVGAKGLTSPWAEQGPDFWPAALGADAEHKCKATGRPALLAGSGVTFAVAKVPPAKEIKWTNPDGDGAYKVTVRNDGDKAVTIPALLSADGKILWKESLMIRCQDKNYPLPGIAAVPAKAGPTTLKPGESVAHEVHALALTGPEWPKGGYRIEFQFCLGEKSSTQSFYYMSRHHDAIRDAQQKKKK